MKFTLKDYQTTAVRDVLINLRKAGYSARLRVSSNGVTRVIIGPLTGTPLELARNDLRSRGLQPFTIR